MTRKERKEEPAEESRKGWERIFAAVQMVGALAIVVFGTWQLFLGNLEAAFSTVPFLVIWYLFLTVGKRK